MTKDANRWEGVYQAKAEGETSWFETRPQVSLDLIAATGIGADAAIVDVGAGSSRLVDCLLEQGFRQITVLDLSETAIAKVRARLPREAPVEWVAGNILDWTPPRRFDIWHDRAAFHFLTDAADQAAYLRVMDTAVLSGGHVIIGTFAIDGPTSCSGLPVARYDAALLSERLTVALGWEDALKRCMQMFHRHEPRQVIGIEALGIDDLLTMGVDDLDRLPFDEAHGPAPARRHNLKVCHHGLVPLLPGGVRPSCSRKCHW